GRYILAAGLRRDHQLTAFTRWPAALAGPSTLAHTVRKAIDGVDAVISTVPPSGARARTTSPRFPGDHPCHDRQGRRSPDVTRSPPASILGTSVTWTWEERCETAIWIGETTERQRGGSRGSFVGGGPSGRSRPSGWRGWRSPGRWPGSATAPSRTTRRRGCPTMPSRPRW